MKIGLAHRRLDNKGGTERDFYRTAEALRDSGHEIHLFCGEFTVAAPAETQAHRVNIIPLGRTARLWSFALRAPQLMRRYDFDVVVSFGRLVRQDVLRCGGGSHRMFLEAAARNGGLSRRVWQNLSVYHQSLLALEKLQFDAQNYKKIVAVSGAVKRELMTAYSVPEHKISVIYNGVDLQRFHPRRRLEARTRIRRQFGVPEHAPMVLFVGSGFRRKGLDRLLGIWNSPKMRDVYLVVVGGDAGWRQYVRRGRANGGDRILFVGPRNNVEDFYGAADAVALPSFQEAFGNVVLEALASGLPVLVSSGVGAAEVLKGSLVQGIVNRPEDVQELETRLLALLERSRDSSCFAEARNLAEHFSWTNHFRRLEAFLSGIQASRCEKAC